MSTSETTIGTSFLSTAYDEAYRSACVDPHSFWLEAPSAGFWYRRPQFALSNDGAPTGTWFPDGMTQMCAAALDRHVDAGTGGKAATIHESGYDGTTTELSYAELHERVARLAGGLRALAYVRVTE